MPYPTAHFALLSALLAFAAASDAASHRIPNAACVAIGAAGLAAQLAVHGAPGAGSGLAAALTLAALLWPAWARRLVGGGDVKLATAAAAWIGLSRLPTYLVATGIAAGALACFSYAVSSVQVRAEIRRNLLAYAHGSATGAVTIGSQRGRAVVPAGAAFAIGAMCALTLGGAR